MKFISTAFFFIVFFAFSALHSSVFGRMAPDSYCPVTPEELAESDVSTEYKGETIYFCCKSCVRDFNKDPESYLGSQEVEAHSHGGDDHTVADENPSDAGHSEMSEAAHDHSAHEETTNPFIALMGKLHVVVIHFPIALIPFAALLQMGWVFTRKQELRKMASLAYCSGTLAAFFAAAMGWVAASQSSYPSLASTLEYHRWLGTSLALLAVAGSFVVIRNRSSFFATTIYLALALLVLVTAHFGGSLIYGPGYFM